MALVMNNQDPRPSSRSSSVKIRRKSSWATLLHPRAAIKASRTHSLSSPDIELASLGDVETEKDLGQFAELGLTLGAEEEQYDNQLVEFPRLEPETHGHDRDGQEALHPVKPFHKWMRTLQRRGRYRSTPRSGASEVESFPEIEDDSLLHDNHGRSSSDSSFAYVAGVRSATISLAGSGATRSRRNTARSSYYARTDRSSRASMSAGRRSEDSIRSERSAIDPTVIERLLQRRRILEELISTEEGYIGDVKFLMNVGCCHVNTPCYTQLTTATGLYYDPRRLALATTRSSDFHQS